MCRQTLHCRIRTYVLKRQLSACLSTMGSYIVHLILIVHSFPTLKSSRHEHLLSFHSVQMSRVGALSLPSCCGLRSDIRTPTSTCCWFFGGPHKLDVLRVASRNVRRFTGGLTCQQMQLYYDIVSRRTLALLPRYHFSTAHSAGMQWLRLVVHEDGSTRASTRNTLAVFKDSGLTLLLFQRCRDLTIRTK